MMIYYSDHFELPLPEGHRFPIEKYTLLREMILQANLVPVEHLRVPEAASDEQILLVHQSDYLNRLKQGTLSPKEIRRIGFPWSPQLIVRSRHSVGGTIAACRSALMDGGVSASLSGGTHHAYADHGEGYCVFNDAAVAARVMQTEGWVERVIILDCDVHQGNGTAAIFADDPSVFTLSIHGEKNFPFHKEKSDLDIALPDGTGDEAYLYALQGGISHSLEQAQADLAIYLAGADPYARDRLGRLSLSKSGIAARDKLVFDACRAYDLPVAVVMSGGYGRQISETVDIHYQTVRLATAYWNNSRDRSNETIPPDD